MPANMVPRSSLTVTIVALDIPYAFVDHLRMLMDTVTQSISIAAPPPAVLDILGDPLRLPEWAPGFSKTVRRDGDRWIVGNGEREVTRHIPVSREHGTVDFLA